MKKIYLAGFEVFKPNPTEEGRRLKELCKKHGLIGLYPLDNECSSSAEIFKANVALIQQSDGIIANVNAFRGFEPDSGTSFEIGYASALAKPVVAYTSENRPMTKWVKDENNFSIEDFGYPVNLMIAESSELVIGTAEDAIIKIKELI